MRLVSTNVADACTLTASGFVTTLPVTNLQTEGRSKVARTTSASAPVNIFGSWASGQQISCAVLYRINASVSGTWRLRLWDAANQLGTLVYDSGDVAMLKAPGWGEFSWGPAVTSAMAAWDAPYCAMWFSAVTAMSFQLTLTDTGNAAGYLQAKRLLMGAHVEPAYNPAYGMTLAVVDSSAQLRTASGSIRSENEAYWRRLSFTFDALSEGERATFLDLIRTVGMRREVFLSVWPTATDSTGRDYTMLGKFVQLPQQAASQFSRFSQSAIFEEA